MVVEAVFQTSSSSVQHVAQRYHVTKFGKLVLHCEFCYTTHPIAVLRFRVVSAALCLNLNLTKTNTNKLLKC